MRSKGVIFKAKRVPQQRENLRGEEDGLEERLLKTAGDRVFTGASKATNG